MFSKSCKLSHKLDTVKPEFFLRKTCNLDYIANKNKCNSFNELSMQPDAVCKKFLEVPYKTTII